MLLLIDAGNTRIKWAMVDHAGQWSASGAVASKAVAQLNQAWRGLSGAPSARVIVANVAGPMLQAQLRQVLQAQALTPEWFGSQPELAGVQNRYRQPAQLGCDRFAAAIGAHALWPNQSLVIATCGTATTIDAVTNAGVFLGGMILPGLGLMAQSLARHTAQLPPIEPHAIDAQPFADNTDEAIVSGCLAAQAGAIERAFAAHAKHHGATRCVLSGGAAAMVAPRLSIPHRRIDNLVLVGLQRVALGTLPVDLAATTTIEPRQPC